MRQTLHIALLSNCTTEYIAIAMKEEYSNNQLASEILNMPYNQYNAEISDPNSNLYRFNPEIIFFCLEGRLLFEEWYRSPVLKSSEELKTSVIQETFESLKTTLETVLTNSKATIIFNNFPVPYYSPLGILDNKAKPGLKDMISILNSKLEEWARDRERLYIFDYHGLCSQYGYDRAKDERMYYLTMSPVSIPFARVLAREYLRYVLPIKNKNRKCLVLDLDNTLWGGIAGEDGLSGITLDISGAGRSFYDFQQELINLYEKGVILAINSKNNLKDAMEIIEDHPHMLLKKNFFAVMKINWKDKSENMLEIARELNIGLDSLVFFDDNPVERELITKLLPQVKVVNVPKDTSKYVDTLRKLADFEVLNLTEDDRKRNEMYLANKRRDEEEHLFHSKEDFLASLQSKLILETANQFNLPRIAQLIGKTNQFNMTTHRYPQDHVKSMSVSADHMVFCASVTDKFGDNGIVGVCLIKLSGDIAQIDTFLLSCRVLSRNIEYCFLSSILAILQSKGIKKVFAYYIETPKNEANKHFYPSAGFQKLSQEGSKTVYLMSEPFTLKSFDYVEIQIESGGK
ncbi:FkbH like protein [Syntrophobotulus glycolicus DSM 8271]|uniref:FkbH like protein n=1 Tax=Syntrophobotulus glycolicus (strain DSM 8271 / FlGlyR) TaxID=645991 RepID=F0SXM7_SYNGF|nr:HAD-IIIC family phosphatase [Syntrophobotulus glycolicus]ADY55860.1 FkbH like protein [Syntrophobotulus glycolicus DSM 8271]